MEFEVAPLPYAKNALEPFMKAETLEFHFEKHHKGYMTNLKGLLEGKPEASRPLVEVIRGSSGGVFNNAAQVWNHTFFWDGLRPGGGGEPAGEVGDLLRRDFGSYGAFREAFVKAGLGRFGSGYAWLVLSEGKAKLIDTPNAETPLTTSDVPLFTVDVWEHAYYLDHRNLRKAFLETVLDHLVNWEFVAKNLRSAG
ncbi:MAG: superoxide dismutase [Polyangiaceae bacterium]|nr:superoxide dismutase [Polyangiaceae bacterium]